MKKLFLLIFLLIQLMSNSLLAQSYLPQVFAITADTLNNYSFEDKDIRILEDCDNNWTVEQVSALPILSRFHENKTMTVGMRYDCAFYWIYYRLHNTMSYDVKLVQATFSDKMELFRKDSLGRWQVLQNGQLIPKNERNGFKTLFAGIIFTIKAGATVDVFLRRTDKYIFNKGYGFRPGISSLRVKEKYYAYEYDSMVISRKNILGGFMLGVIFLLTVFNISFFTVSKEKIYFYYVIFLLCLGIGRNLEIIYNAFLPNYPNLYWYGKEVILFGHFVGLIQFIRYLLPINNYFPKLDKFLLPYTIIIFIIAKSLVFLKAPLSFQTDAILSFISELMLISIYILIPLILILLRRKKDKNVTRIFMFTAPVLVSWIAGTLVISVLSLSVKVYKMTIRNNGLYRYKELNLQIEWIALLWLVSFFAWELIKRYNVLRQEISRQATERERLAKESEMERNQLIAAQNETLERQVKERTAELQTSLNTLKSTQNQLIQKEKMASLGELTSGIAHEIQNPLNFVNNFSELSVELITELKEERNKKQGDRDEELEDELLTDLAENQEKINHHGKRASSIVKGMLEHSRTSTGVKELTDINKLADEYLRLSYHGLRAKDSSFNADFKTDFDEDLPKVEVIPQDFGRVLLNLINNAFYAVSNHVHVETGHALSLQSQYQPTVNISTQQYNNQIIIKVTDNGTGMSEATKAKIFQPFFTTKPTGEGTGLGLSLAYDIITKGHEGTIEVESVEGGGSSFIVKIPIKNS